MRFPTALVAALVFTGCALTTSTQVDEKPMQLDDAKFADYWHQLERRWPLAGPEYRAHPLPSPESIRDQVRFYEFPADQHESCFYRVGTGSVYVGEGRWSSGCVPHEIGHAVCDLTYGHEDWCFEFEHPKGE